MGSSTSTHTTSEIKDILSKEEPSSVSGREEQPDEDIVVVDNAHLISTEEEVLDMVETSDEESSDDDGSDEETDDSDDEEEEEDEEWIERLKILEDARNLRCVAEFFMHPENSVVVDDTACARCIYSRPSAEEQTSAEEEAEAAVVLADAQQMKKLASDYLHPEQPVMTEDSTAFARNFFTRYSAADQEDEEDAEERAKALEDAKQLKELAEAYHHPENPVVATGAALLGRNYFSRPSAEEYDDEEEAEERASILEEMKQLKKLSLDYLHPENPVATTDSTVFARNYFSRPSAELYDDDEEAERVQILNDAAELKKLVVGYLHPELPVNVDSAVVGRNYFSRPSAEEYEDEEEAKERARILEETKQLKKLSVDYLHPENPVATLDSTVFARNYFSRPSAELYEEEEVERAQILNDAAELKKLAVGYLHPELPVNVDSAAVGRNYFSRPSAEEYDDEEEAEERACILEETKQLKKSSLDYLHPENPVATTDSTVFARNYFSRPSAELYDDEEEAERSLVLNDALELKKLAVGYLHPELPVSVDSAAVGRNYFSRPSVEEYDDEEEAEERARILEETKQLKKLSVDFLHPENSVATTDSTVFARNYFGRPSAELYDDEEEAERSLVLNDALELKKLAVGYLHPELPVNVDSVAVGRNYFSRPSAEEYEDEEEAEERARILEETKQFKKLAVDYFHPENRVVGVDPTASGRNYFSRPSADIEDEEERAQVLAEAAQLKKFAVDYLHPEKSVVTSDPCASGRNYFTRASAPQQSELAGSQQESKKQYSIPIFPKTIQTKGAPFKGEQSKLAPESEKKTDVILHKSPSAVMLFGGNDSDMMF